MIGRGRICILCFELACVLIKHTKGASKEMSINGNIGLLNTSGHTSAIWTHFSYQQNVYLFMNSDKQPNPPPKSFTSIVNICRHTCSCRRTCHNKILKPWLILPFFFISPHPTWPRDPQTSGNGNRCSRVFRPIKQTIREAVRMIQLATFSCSLHHFQVTCKSSAGSAGAVWRLQALNSSQETFP